MIRSLIEWSADIPVRKFCSTRVPYASALALLLCSGCVCPRGPDRHFNLQHDSFSFANELRWNYEFTDSGEVITQQTEPAPEYSLRCFPMARAAREFFYHAQFEPEGRKATKKEYREMIAAVTRRNSRCPANPDEKIVVPGFRNLHEFSAENAELLKSQCGGATHSFLQRGNWRMVFPVTKSGEKKTAERILAELNEHRLPIVHVYQFPNTTLNHAVLIYAAEQSPSAITFIAYDPNDPTRPAALTFDRETRTFLLERNRYFAGGTVKVYEVFRGIFF